MWRLSKVIPVVALIVSLIVSSFSPLQTPAFADTDGPELPPLPLLSKGNPKLDSRLNQLLLRASSPNEAATFAQQAGIGYAEGKVRVIVESLPDEVEAARGEARGLGTVEAQYNNLLQVLLPIQQLTALANRQSVRLIRMPCEFFPDAVSKGVSLIDADTWHSANITGLAPNTTYHFRAKPVIAGGTSYGADRTFSTLYTPPSVTTDNATNLGPYSARLNGTLTDLGTVSSANVSFMWGTSLGNLTSETTIQSANATGSYYFDLGGLSANTTYYCEAKAVGHGTAYGNELSFTTASVAAPPSFLFKWGSVGNGDGQFSAPDGIAIDSSGNVYVADTGNHRIQKFTSSGQFITKWGSLGNSDGQFYSPHGVAVDSSGNVYVVDTSNHRIQKFTSSGQFITKWGSFGDDDGQFNNPYDLAVDSSGNVYVADTYSHRVQKFTENGAFLAKWGSAGYGDGQLNYPQGIAVDSSGSVYVSDYATSHRVQKFSDNGTFLIKWGSEGSGDGQFFDPRGLAVDRSDNVYVVDWGNGRIQKFSDNGTFLSKWGQFNGPYGVAVNSIGNVYVVENGNNQVQVFGTPMPPSVTTDNASNLGYYWARLNGNLTDLGTATSAQVSFTWGLSSGNYTAATSEQTINTAGAFHFDLSALSANTTYYYRAKAVGHGTVFGDERVFTTSPSDSPGVATDNATDRTTNSAVLNGTLFSRGTASSANVSFEWGTSSGNYPAETFPQSMNSTGSFR